MFKMNWKNKQKTSRIEKNKTNTCEHYKLFKWQSINFDKEKTKSILSLTSI